MEFTKPKLVIIGLFFLPALSFANALVFSSSPLLTGTKIVAGDPNKNEFFILAQNEKPPRELQMLAKTKSFAPAPAKDTKSPNIMLAKATPKKIQVPVNHSVEAHWVPKLKKALADVKQSQKNSPTHKSQIVRKKSRVTKKVYAMKKKQHYRQANLKRNKSSKPSAKFMTFHVAVYDPVKKNEKAKNPATARLAHKKTPLKPHLKPHSIDQEQVVAFNGD